MYPFDGGNIAMLCLDERLIEGIEVLQNDIMDCVGLFSRKTQKAIR